MSDDVDLERECQALHWLEGLGIYPPGYHDICCALPHDT